MITMVMENAEERRKNVRQKTAKPMLWIGMVSIVMFFGGLTSAVIVEFGKGDWAGFSIPFPFMLSTLVILLSSFTFYMAIRMARKDDLTAEKKWMGATLLFAIGFMVTQYFGWQSLIEQGVYFTGPGQAVSGSYFYVLTWAHFAHAAGGIISLIVVFTKSLKGIYNSKNLLGLQLSATYWHFLGVLWVYLFIFLNYINQNF